MIDFKQILIEAEMLDISIVSAKKYLTSDAKIQKFFETPVRVEHKTDGVKISVIKTNNKEQPWVFAYKGSVIYDGEFEYASKSALKKSSISNSQFQIILDHFKMLPNTSVDKIKPNTEFFIEFLMRKPTLSSNYEKSHGMVLLAYSPTVWSEKFGRLVSKPKDFITDDREEKAKLLKLDVPQLLFEGILGSSKMFENGIKNKNLQAVYNKNKNSLKFEDYNILLGQIQEMFLEVESKYGGVEEGVVVKFLDSSGTLLKFQQDYQVDQQARAAIKDKYRGTPEEEDMYYKQVRLVALDIINHIEITKDLPGMLSEFSKKLKAQRINIEHGVKVKVNILDDIFNTGKMIITKKMKGNNGALYLGKFRVLTTAHYNIIKDAFAVYDHVVVALVTSTETKDTRELRERMLMTAFPKLEIVNVQNGNLFTIMNKASSNINVILAGSDRVAGYKKMLEKNPDIRVREIKRTDEDISASKVVEALKVDDINTFKNMVDKSIWPFYEELRRVYANTL
jgi:nicotinamide mononucleotide adenylyltransferase